MVGEFGQAEESLTLMRPFGVGGNSGELAMTAHHSINSCRLWKKKASRA